MKSDHHDRRTVASAHARLDDLLITMTEHLSSCSIEGRAQNARLARLEKILIGTAGSTICLLLLLIFNP